MAVLTVLISLLALARQGSAALDGSRYLWYNSPATAFESALPLGNGRLGAMIYGGGQEIIGLNENSIWAGPFQDRTPYNATQARPEVLKLMQKGNLTLAGQLTLANMTDTTASPRSYSYFGNVVIDFGHEEQSMSNYVRWLDTAQGNSGLSYTFNKVKYDREYIASYPAGVIAARFTASKKGALNMNVSMTRTSNIQSNVASVANGTSSVTLMASSGQSASQGPILWTGQARFVLNGGKSSVSDSALVISGADSVDMFFDCETNYRYSTQALWEGEMNKKLDAAVKQGYDSVKKNGIADAKSLLSRASLDLGPSVNETADLPTDQRVAIARDNTGDFQLVTLVWNYGRHLLVASSRNTGMGLSLPANLQGIWSNSTSPPWGGKYTININIEMNYWPAGPTNLIETQEALVDLMAISKPRGEYLAQHMYNCPGTVFHHNLDLWGDGAPTDNYTSSTMWPMGAAWMSVHMMDHYRYTLNETYLREVAYPFLLDVARFYECYTFQFEGYAATGPSLSPENTFQIPANETVALASAAMDINPSMDNQLMYELFNNVLESASILGISDSDADVAAAKEFLPQIKPPQIGSLGQILEWRTEYTETSVGQKHLSPLWALHPGRQFSPLLNSTLGTAATVLLNRRVSHGSGSTGWSRTWLINQYARVFNGDAAWGQLVEWFQVYPVDNLWNTNQGPPFQIDGNFGFTSGVTEMLLQSHADVVHLLPALPSAVPTGSVHGLMARGVFEVDISWAKGHFVKATVTSKLGGELSLRLQNGTAIEVNGKLYTGPLSTKAGSKYVVTVKK